jgi:glycosyltransferase involved in cell wall biosynthesis
MLSPRDAVSRPIRLTVLMTHPVQYFSPWFRHITEQCPEIDLTVLYGAIPAPEQQGAAFGRAFNWDIPLTEGHRVAVCSDAAGKSFDSDHFLGIDVPDIERHLMATSPEVVLVPGWHSVMQLRAIRACRRRRIPVLYRGDSTFFSGPRRLVRPLWRLKTRYMLRQFDGYLAVGTHADDYLRRFGAPDPLIARSPHSVDNARFHREADRLRAGDSRAQLRAAIGADASDFVVLFAGRLHARKRPLEAVRAVARLGPSAMLLTAGDGPLAADTHAEAERLGVRLAWRGFLNQSELPAAFATADAVLVPSAWESWGLIVNEALASGVPCVVTTRVACAPDLIVEGVTGHAVERSDIGAMAARLADIRASLARGHDFAGACRRQADTCSFEAATLGLRTVCERVVTRRLPATPPPAPARVVACCGNMVSVFGSERMTFEVLRVLRRHGAAVHCLLNSWGSSHIVPLAMEIGATWTPGHYREPVRRRGLTVAAVARMARDVAQTSAALWRDARAFRATHVLVPDFIAVLRNLPALVLLRLGGTAVVMKVGNAPDSSGFYDRLWRWSIAPLVDSFVANSQFTAAALKRVGVPARKVSVVAHSAPTRSRPAGPAAFDATRVIYVGQIIPPKGPDLLLDAVGALVGRGVDATVDLVGDIDGWESPVWAGYHARLRARAAEPDLTGRVRFLGRREDVPDLLAGAAVHCAPSRLEIREGFGVVVVEAKAAGVPSVVTPSGGLPELIDHRRDGWVCGEATADAIADGLEYFLADARRRDEAGAAARQSAHRVSHTAFSRAWLETFGLAPAPLPAAAGTALEHHAH